MFLEYMKILDWICRLLLEFSSKKSIAVGGLPFELREENKRWDIYDEARKSIQNNNVPEMTLDEINAEIYAVRNEA